MVENLLKEMEFPTEPTVEYDPHHVISNRKKDVKGNSFKHKEVVGLVEVANWDD